MKIFASIVILIITSGLSYSKNTTDDTASLNGFIRDAESGETLIGANVLLKDSDLGSTTNTSGYFQIRRIPAGSYTVRISYVGYETYETEITLEAGEEKRLDLDLRSTGYELEEVTVTSEHEREERRNIGRRNISVDQITQNPGVLQADVFRSMQLLPGVSAASDFSSGLYIRGGSPDQTLIQLDQTTVYNPSHFFGFFSTFNPDAIKDVQLYKGTYPAKYGGRLGSVVDIYNKDGNRNRHGGSVSFGFLSSRAMAEGPITNGSYMVAFRRSTLEPVLALMRGEVEGVPDEFYFYDLNAKLNYSVDENNHLEAAFYAGTDDVDLSFENTNFNLRYGNRTFSTSWTHIANSSIFTTFRFTGSQYFNYPYADIGGTEFERDNKVTELSLRADMEWLPADNHELIAGIWGGNIGFTLADTFDGTQTLNSSMESWYTSAYIQDEWRPDPQWRINAGLRTEFFSRGDYWRVGPRLSVDYFLNERLRLQAGYGRYYQFLTLVTNEAFSGFDVWLTTDENVPPAYSDQFAAGLKYEPFENWEVELEGYYRTMNDLFELDPFQGDVGGFDYEELFRFGEGYAYGLELLLERTTGDINGFLGYTYGRTWRKFPGFNEGRHFPPRFDRTHDITAMINYEISNNWQLSTTFSYQTGQAYTEPTGRSGLSNSPFQNTKTNTLIVEKVNASRMPAYHRMDVSATRKGDFFDIAESELQFQIINLYSRRNIWFFSYDFDENPPEVQEFPLLPILPSITYTLNF